MAFVCNRQPLSQDVLWNDGLCIPVSFLLAQGLVPSTLVPLLMNTGYSLHQLWLLLIVGPRLPPFPCTQMTA